MKKRIKTWHYWHQFFFQMFKDVNNMLPRHQGSQFSIWDYTDHDERNQLNSKCYFEANAACKSFITKGYWDSAIPVDVLCAILCRIQEAVDFCLDLNLWQGSKTNVVVRPPDPSITPYEEILSFFLLKMHKSTFIETHSNQAISS